MIRRLLPLIVFIGFSALKAYGMPIMFPKDDAFKTDKLLAIDVIQQAMGTNNSVSKIIASDAIIFWANEWKDPLFVVDPKTKQLPPSFIALTPQNEHDIRQQIEAQCECSVRDKKIIGVLVAHPLQAAIMYLRKGWNNNTGKEIDGRVAPIVIIYHEFSHANDYLSNPQFFLDSSSTLSKQWKNEAEHSAVEQQNDFVNTMNFLKRPIGSTRRSYGKNTLYLVDSVLSF